MLLGMLHTKWTIWSSALIAAAARLIGSTERMSYHFDECMFAWASLAGVNCLNNWVQSSRGDSDLITTQERFCPFAITWP